MSEITFPVRFPFVCLLQLLPEPPLSAICTAESKPQKQLICKLRAVQVATLQATGLMLVQVPLQVAVLSG